MFRRDAYAIILDPGSDVIVPPDTVDAHVTGPIRTYEFQRIVDQVCENLLQRRRMHANRSQWRLNLNVGTPFPDFMITDSYNLAEHILDVNVGERHVRPRKLAVSEQVAEQIVHVPCRPDDAARIIQAVRAEIGAFLFEKCLGEAAHRPQRRPQVVRDRIVERLQFAIHIRQRGDALFQRIVQSADFFLALFSRRDIAGENINQPLRRKWRGRPAQPAVTSIFVTEAAFEICDRRAALEFRHFPAIIAASSGCTSSSPEIACNSCSV